MQFRSPNSSHRLTQRAEVDTALWIATDILAGVFLGTALNKLIVPKEKLVKRMAWAGEFSQRDLRVIAAFEVVAVIGLVLPAALNSATVVVPLAAVGVMFLMLGAGRTHLRRHETALLASTVVLFLLAGFVAWGRFTDYRL
jgi:hypothetical protein